MNLIVLPLLILVLSFTEILVYNEEVLLTFCFLSFLIYAYYQLAETAEQNFLETAKSYEVQMIDAFISNYNSLRNTSQLLVKLLFILPSFDMILYYINSNINKKRNTAITFLNNYVTAVIDDMVLSITMAESSSVNKLVQSNVEATLFSLVSSKQLLQLSAKFNAVPSVSNTQSSRVLNLLKQL
jgi:hypothetical protein